MAGPLRPQKARGGRLRFSSDRDPGYRRPGRGKRTRYIDDAGDRRAVSSEDANDYLRQISGADVTAKDFRTWAGTLMAFRALLHEKTSEHESVRLRRAKRALQHAADALGNTPAVTRASYVHHDVLDAWHEGDLERMRVPDSEPPDGHPWDAASPGEEAALLRLLYS